MRPASNQRKLYLSLTEAGETLKEKAVLVAQQMQGCIALSNTELLELKYLLDRALVHM